MAGANNLADQYVQHGSLIENSDKINWGEFGKDVVVGGVSGFVTGYVGASIGGFLTNILSRTRIGSTLLNSATRITRFGTGTVIGSVSEVGSGIVSRGVVSFVTSNGDANAAMDAAFDLNQIAFDATIGGVTGGYRAAKSPIGRKITIDDLNKELLQTKPKYSPAPKRWLEEVGGEIYVDANGTWTYQALDGVHVCYNNGHPNFQRAGLGEKKQTLEVSAKNGMTTLRLPTAHIPRVRHPHGIIAKMGKRCLLSTQSTTSCSPIGVDFQL